jgi:hypothetical protein
MPAMKEKLKQQSQSFALDFAENSPHYISKIIIDFINLKASYFYQLF